MLDSPFGKTYDGIYSLDVLEHIQKENEHLFMKNICESLATNGFVGMPS